MQAVIFSRLIPFLAATFCLSTVAMVNGQPVGNVTVQLPTFEQFGVSTTVIVPDNGSLYLGGVNGSSLGRNSFRPGVPGLGRRGIGRSAAASGMAISATIIDHSEIDRALLAEAARRRGDTVDMHGRPVADARRLSPAVTARRAEMKVRDGRNSLAPQRFRLPVQGRVKPQTSVSSNSTATTYLHRAQRAEANGQPHQAIVFYRRIVKHGDAELKRRAELRLAELAKVTAR